MYWVSSQCSTMQHNVTQCSTMYCATSQCSGVMRQQKVIESWIKVSLCHLCSSLLVVQGDRATMCHLVEVPSIYWRIYKEEPTALDLVTLCHLPAPTYSVSLLCQLSLLISITWHLIARVCRIKNPPLSQVTLWWCIQVQMHDWRQMYTHYCTHWMIGHIVQRERIVRRSIMDYTVCAPSPDQLTFTWVKL